jgi:DNA-binding beta-propeller fold protein YncE
VDINPRTHVAAVTNSLTGTLTLIDLNTQTVLGSPLAIAAQPGAVAIHPAANVATVADAVASTVTRVDLGDSSTFKNYTLSFVSPRSTAPSAGSGPSLDLRANGTAFQSGHNVAYGDLLLSSTLANAGRLVGTLPFTAFSAVAAETVTVVDTSANLRTNAVDFRVEKTLSVGQGPTGLAINPNSKLGIVVNGLDSTASVLDLEPGTGTVRSTITLTASSSPAGVVINPFNNVALITLRARNQVAVVDLITASQISTLNVGSDPVGVALNPTTSVAVVTNAGDNNVSVIKLGSGLVDTIGTGQVAPAAVAINNVTNQAVVVNNGSSSVSVIDLAADPPAVIGTPIPLAPAADPRAIVIDETTNTAFVAQFATNSIAQIDLATRTLTRILPGGKDPIALALNPNTKELFISQAGLGRVAVVDLTQATPSVVDFVLAGAGPQGVGIDPFTNQAVVANHDDNSVTFSRPLH